MHIIQKYLNLPFPLQIVFDLVPGDRHPEVRATAPAWPAIQGGGRDLDEALDSLLPQISDLHRPKASCIAALRAAGHSDSTIAAWSRHIAGYRLWALRNDGDEAVWRLAAYAAGGIGPVDACHFLAIGISPHQAAILQERGIGPDAAVPYAERFGNFWVDHYGEDVPCIEALNDHEIVDWLVSDFDLDQAAFYMDANVSPAMASEWRETVDKHRFSAQDLRDMIRAGYSTDDVEKSASRDASGAFLPAQAARTMLALGGRPRYGSDPWAAPSPSPHDEEPPF